MLTVTEAMRRAVHAFADREAVVTAEGTLTFADAWRRGVQLANHLTALGADPGDRVAVLERNGLRSSDVYLACCIGNFVRVPLFWRDSPEAHEYMVTNSEATVLVADPEVADVASKLLADVEGLRAVVLRDADYDATLDGASTEEREVPIALDDLHLLRYSAGTTGRPKGVAHTNRTWMSTLRDWTYGLPSMEPGDGCLHMGPISHGSGYLFTPLWVHGGRNVLVSTFEAREAIELFVSEAIAYAFVVPTMLSALVDAHGDLGVELPALKGIVVAGAPLADRTALRAREAFGDRLYQLYGQSEAGPITWLGPKEWFGDECSQPRLGTVGRAGPWARIAIRSDDGRDLPPGEVGEIAMTCDGQLSGYWRDEEMTQRRIVDGWVLSGDMGYVDESGYLFMVDRKDDMIISGGFNIWPAELENAILSLDDVLEVAVVGVPDERWGETPLAVCVVAAGAEVTEADVVRVCAERLGSYKKPSHVTLTSEPLPKSAVGKVLRRVVRAPYWTERERFVSGG